MPICCSLQKNKQKDKKQKNKNTRILRNFQVGEHVEVLGERHTKRGNGRMEVLALSTFLALCISSICLFLSYILLLQDFLPQYLRFIVSQLQKNEEVDTKWAAGKKLWEYKIRKESSLHREGTLENECLRTISKGHCFIRLWSALPHPFLHIPSQVLPLLAWQL